MAGPRPRILYNALIRVTGTQRLPIAPYCPTWTTSGETTTCPPTGSWSPTRKLRPQRPPRPVNAAGRPARPKAGIYLWYLAIVGGSAWKMEACLTRFAVST